MIQPSDNRAPRNDPRRSFLFGLALLLATSCATFKPQAALKIEPFDPPSHYISNVPFVPATGMRCGPAALTSALNFFGVEAGIDDVASAVMESEAIGSHIERMFAYAVGRGMKATIYTGGTRDLKRQLAQGRPVIVLLDFGILRPSGHFVLVVGYNEQGFITYDSQTKDKVVSEHVLYAAWARMKFATLLVMPAEESLPPTTAELIEAGLREEEAGNWVEAERLYRLALERDEVSVAAIIGVGNARYNLKDYETAIRWYRLALRNDHTRADALVNLSQCYLALGKLNEAEKTARKAIKLRSKFDVYAYEALGDALAAKGEKKEAVVAYTTAVALIVGPQDELLKSLQSKIENLLK